MRRSRWTTGLAFSLLVFLGAPAHADEESVPPGWQLAGSSPESFEVSIQMQDEGAMATLQSKADPGERNFGTLMQTVSARDYRGTRLRLSATVSANIQRGWAGLWMRIDGTRRQMLGFDNMADRRLTGSTAFARHEVVLEVPSEAEAIAFGVLLAGEGRVQMRSVELEVVDSTTPLTAPPRTAKGPVNLGFES